MNTTIAAQQVDPNSYQSQLRAASDGQVSPIGVHHLVADGRSGRLMVAGEYRIRRPMSSNAATYLLAVGTYASGDSIGGLCTMELDYQGGSVIESVVLVDGNKQNSPLDILLFQSAPADSVVDNVAPAFGSASVGELVGLIRVLGSDYVDIGSQSVVSKLVLLPAVIVNVEAVLYAVVLARGAATYSGASLKVWFIIKPA